MDHGPELYHGTTTAAIRAAQACDALRARAPRELAEEVERSLGLPAGSILDHKAFMFSAERAGDDRIYLDSRLRTASHYARVGSEMLEDALKAAFQLIHPELVGSYYARQGSPARTAAHTAMRTFARDWMTARDIAPLVLRIVIPWCELHRCDDYVHYQRTRPGEGPTEIRAWWEHVTDNGRWEFGTLMFAGELPLAWIAEQLAGDQLDAEPSLVTPQAA